MTDDTRRDEISRCSCTGFVEWADALGVPETKTENSMTRDCSTCGNATIIGPDIALALIRGQMSHWRCAACQALNRYEPAVPVVETQEGPR